MRRDERLGKGGGVKPREGGGEKRKNMKISRKKRKKKSGKRFRRKDKKVHGCVCYTVLIRVQSTKYASVAKQLLWTISFVLFCSSFLFSF